VKKLGAVNLTLIQAHQQMGVPEIISYGLNMGDTIPSKLIKKFADGYAAIETYKEVLLWNLFILTIHVIHLSLSTFSNLLILKIHFIVSLFLGAIFYLYFMNQFSTIVFSEVNANL
jgi:hypothetical protein